MNKSPFNEAAKFARALGAAFAEIFLQSSPASLSGMIGRAVAEAFIDIGVLSKKEQEDIRTRAELASQHLTEAGNILDELHGEITVRKQELDSLLEAIKAKQSEANQWAQLASVNEDLASVLTEEIERRVREQIRNELDRNRKMKRVLSIVVWVITLILGGIIGVLVQELWRSGLSH